MAIEAAVWRDERRQRELLQVAWHVAALQRTKRLPSLKQFMTPPARQLRGPELEKRRTEFQQAKQTVQANMSSLAGRLEKLRIENELRRSQRTNSGDAR